MLAVVGGQDGIGGGAVAGWALRALDRQEQGLFCQLGWGRTI